MGELEVLYSSQAQPVRLSGRAGNELNSIRCPLLLHTGLNVESTENKVRLLQQVEISLASLEAF